MPRKREASMIKFSFPQTCIREGTEAAMGRNCVKSVAVVQRCTRN